MGITSQTRTAWLYMEERHLETWGVAWIYQNILDLCLGAWKAVHSANLQCCFFLQGVKEHSVPVGLDGKAQVDLVVVGSVAVSEKGKEELPAEGSQSQSSVSKATPRGRDRFILGAELWSWVLPLCV